MQYIFCVVSVAAMRKEPSHRSEMVSQLLFGEYGIVLEEKDDFVRIKCLFDGYEGWCASNQIAFVTKNDILETTQYVNAETTEVQLKNAGSMQVSFSTPVYTVDDAPVLTFGEYEFSYNAGKNNIWDAQKAVFSEDNIRKISNHFINTAYLWGGRSIYGLDCSGFVQQVYKMFDIRLLRDAHLQADQGKSVPGLKEARIGDAAFFHNDAGRIIHVGILLSNTEIIHASGKVRIDNIDEEGIINKETGKRTHHLTCIRRMKELVS
jgi:cell wall-associated NlpC family hydrolase